MIVLYHFIILIVCLTEDTRDVKYFPYLKSITPLAMQIEVETKSKNLTRPVHSTDLSICDGL